MPKLKNNRYEMFAQGIFAGKSGTQAAKDAGYSQKTAQPQSSRLLSIVIIQERVAELFKKTESSAIMSKQELAQMFTRMLRTLHSDFLTMSADGVWFHDIGPETIGQEALKKVKTRVVTISGQDKEGEATKSNIIEKQFDEIEMESKVSIGQALAKLMGYNSPDKMDLSGELTEHKEFTHTIREGLTNGGANNIANLCKRLRFGNTKSGDDGAHDDQGQVASSASPDAAE